MYVKNFIRAQLSYFTMLNPIRRLPASKIYYLVNGLGDSPLDFDFADAVVPKG